MGYFPFFIDIKGKKGLVIGGGRIAEQASFLHMSRNLQLLQER